MYNLNRCREYSILKVITSKVQSSRNKKESSRKEEEQKKEKEEENYRPRSRCKVADKTMFPGFSSKTLAPIMLPTDGAHPLISKCQSKR